MLKRLHMDIISDGFRGENQHLVAKSGDKAVVTFLVGIEVEVILDDYHPYEPSAYCWDPGWDAYDEDKNFYYLSESGDVYSDDNKRIGTHNKGLEYR